ncbi:hypothetical protein COOONC_10943 [Cooperia oncophora]
MLFALAGLCLLVMNVGAEFRCLSFHPLYPIFKEFHRRNPNLEWSRELASFACDEVKYNEPHSVKHKLLVESNFNGKPNAFAVRRTLTKATNEQKEQIRTLSGATQYGCDAWNEGEYDESYIRTLSGATQYGCDAWNEGKTMKVMCLYD